MDLKYPYICVPPVMSNIKNVSHPAARVTLLARQVKPHKEAEYLWLHKARQVLDGNDGAEDNISWATFPASWLPPETEPICPSALLRMFQESAHRVAMIRHSIDIVNNAVQHLNPEKTPVVTFDQPLFALAKQIQ